MRKRAPFPSTWKRYGTAVALLVAVSLVIGSPIWHHGHHLPTAAAGDAHRGEIHLCSTGGHGKPQISCAICSSQRLLGQSDTEAAAQLTAPTESAGLWIVRLHPTEISFSHTERARAPPTA